jgi:hypothetical protein
MDYSPPFGLGATLHRIQVIKQSPDKEPNDKTRMLTLHVIYLLLRRN